MGSGLFRSEVMSLIQIYIPIEMAHSSMSGLGELGLIQFIDMNVGINPFQREYTSNIKLLDDMSRHVDYLIQETKSMNIDLEGSCRVETGKTSKQMEELSEYLIEYENKIRKINDSYEELLSKQVELNEIRHTLRVSSLFFENIDKKSGVLNSEGLVTNRFSSTNIGNLDIIGTPNNVVTSQSIVDTYEDLELGNSDEKTKDVSRSQDGCASQVFFKSSKTVGFVTGVVPTTRSSILEKILWRALRGNVYMFFVHIEEAFHGVSARDTVQKSVFIISSHGEETVAKVVKICEALGAHVYEINALCGSKSESEYYSSLSSKISDAEDVLSSLEQMKLSELSKISGDLNRWLLLISQEKAVYGTLNLCNYDVNKKCLIAEGWTPNRCIPDIHHSLDLISKSSNLNVNSVVNEIITDLSPPTCHNTNKFTVAFQDIIDSYGIASYREVNPGLYTIITFPFLFSIMFGDFGHGLILALFALWMVLYEKRLSKLEYGEIWEMVFGGRYILLLMGMFSLYAGLIYNDTFSRTFYLFPSNFGFNKTTGEGYVIDTEYTYPFGIDYGWHGAKNSLVFLNSYKMKQSILLGLFQMNFGIVLSAINMLHLRDIDAIVGVFLPQVLFMFSIFGYLGILIVYKWIIQTHSTPSLLDTILNMVLSPGNIAPENVLYTGQAYVQSFLLMVAFVCVPVMFLYKPLMMRMRHAKGQRVVGHGSSDKFDFAEEFIQQSIHSIEFVLGSVSNTASYLRLWALSLAHAQLSDVLWDMLAERARLGVVFSILMFAAWLFFTVFILVLMEGLSAFLHALRLHWVEFNNKFYSGSGHKFVPFELHNIKTSPIA